MGFWDFLKRPVTPVVYEPRTTFLGAGEMLPFTEAIRGMTVARLWREQPHLRTVVAFRARNVAQVALHVYQHQDDGGRLRDRTSPLARALRRPGDGKTAYDLIFALIGDIDLYDRAYWLPWWDDQGNPRIRRLPPSMVTPISDNYFAITSYIISNGVGGTVEVPADQILDFTGYSPTSVTHGSPTIESLKSTIEEQIEATKYRLQVWKRGGRVSAVIERPVDAPDWSPEAANAFREDWYAKYTGTGPKAGGTPVLEDGMKLNRIDFSAHEQEFVEAAKLSLTTVSAAYHVNPTMVGLLDAANYSNMREFRRMLYGESLGPDVKKIEDRINTDLTVMFGMDDTYYGEFNIAEKLQGSFEEQAGVMQTMVGAPVLTRNEGRARFNLPAIEGGDELVTPLNVLIGGQASPTDSGSQNEKPKALGTGPWFKAATPAQQEQIGRVIDGFLKRQGASVLAAIGAGGKDWWDGDRWNRELAADLTKVSHTIADILGKAQAERLGYPDGFDPDRTVNFLKTVMARKAGNINDTTRKQLEAAIAADDGDPAAVFAPDTRATRSTVLAVGLGTFTASFAAGEAARQIAYDHGGSPTKTWITGPNPRQSHAAMNGETVPIDQPFSNGCMWPADGPEVDEVAGCNCEVQIDF